MKKTTFNAVLRERTVPVVAIDEEGIFVFVNDCFEKEYGWSAHELLGKVVTTIMPPYMRDAHNLGFSRFLATETPRIIGKPLALPVYCKDGTLREAEHLILAKRHNGAWRFAARITPRRKQGKKHALRTPTTKKS